MEVISTYIITNIQHIKKTVIASLFLVFLVASPALQVSSAFKNIKLEIVDISEKEESSKQENISEIEKDKLILQILDGLSVQTNYLKSSLFYEAHSSYLNYHKDIHLPPPEHFSRFKSTLRFYS